MAVTQQRRAFFFFFFPWQRLARAVSLSPSLLSQMNYWRRTNPFSGIFLERGRARVNGENRTKYATTLRKQFSPFSSCNVTLVPMPSIQAIVIVFHASIREDMAEDLINMSLRKNSGLQKIWQFLDMPLVNWCVRFIYHWELTTNHLRFCLLYTSPSPRD